MKKQQQVIGACLLYSISARVIANLPVPPVSDYSSNSQDWITVGQNLGVRAAHMFLLLLGAAILGGVAAGIFRGYQAAQERQETSLFFKAVGVGIIWSSITAPPSLR